MSWQVDTVRKAPSGIDVPINPALCFIGTDWRLLARPFQQDGVWVISPKRLVERVRGPVVLNVDTIATLASRLAVAFPPTTAA